MWRQTSGHKAACSPLPALAAISVNSRNKKTQSTVQLPLRARSAARPARRVRPPGPSWRPCPRHHPRKSPWPPRARRRRAPRHCTAMQHTLSSCHNGRVQMSRCSHLALLLALCMCVCVCLCVWLLFPRAALVRATAAAGATSAAAAHMPLQPRVNQG